MKKLFILLISLLSFTFIVNATEEWNFGELKFSEDFGITAIAFDKDNNIIALGKEYDCTNKYNSETDKCNVYKIDTDGKVSKYNMYYDNTDNDFPGYTYPKVTLEGSKLRLQTIYKSMIPSKSDSLVEAAVVRYAHEDKDFNFLYCSPDVKEKIDICVVGVEGSGYGIINSKGEFLVEPSTNYSKAFDDYNDKLPLLKDNNNNYVVVTANGKPEIIEKAFLDEIDFSIDKTKVSNYDDNINYYVYYYNPCSNEQNCESQQTLNFFLKDKFLVATNRADKIEFIGGTPYIGKRIYHNNLTYEYNVYAIVENGISPILLNVYGVSFGHQLFSYNEGNKFYITDMNNNIVVKDFSEYAQTIDQYRGIELAATNESVYIYKDSRVFWPVDENWIPKYYILTKGSKKETLPISEEPTEKPQQVVEPKGIEDIEEEKEETKTYTCKRVDGIFYDKNGDVVTKAEYEKSCPEVVPDTGYITPIITISVLAGGILILRKKNIISKI